MTKLKHKLEEAPFDKALRQLLEGYEIASLEDSSQVRIQEGKDSQVSRYGFHTKEGFVHIPKKGIFLVKYSPVLDNPEKATQAHRNGKEFFITDKQSEKALEDSVQLPYNLKSAPVKVFGNDEITTFAFGDQARAYGEFLREAGIKEMPFWLVDKDYINKQDQPFARQLWFRSLDDWSELDGDYRNLLYYDRLLGVQKSGRATQKKSAPNQRIKRPYTARQVDKATKIVSRVRQGDLPASKLEQVVEFLTKLKG